MKKIIFEINKANCIMTAEGMQKALANSVGPWCSKRVIRGKL